MAATKAILQRGVETRDRIAEMVANGASVNSCAKALGLSENAVSKAWRKIVADLGEQAR